MKNDSNKIDNIFYKLPQKQKVLCKETNSSVQIGFNEFNSLNQANVKAVYAKIRKHLSTGKDIVMNLRGIENIDTKGLALLVHLNKTLNSSQADLVVTNPSQSMKKIFWITELDRLIKIKKN